MYSSQSYEHAYQSDMDESQEEESCLSAVNKVQAKDIMSSLYSWEKVEETRDRIFLNLRCCLVTYLLEHRALDGSSTTRKQTLSALYTLFASSRHLKVDPRDG